MPATIRFRLNGRDITLETEGTRSLLWVLRTDLGLTGTKYGCGINRCGACTVLVDGRPRRSCQVSLGRIQGADVVTIEGLAGMVGGGALHPLQEEFADRGGFQCGFCTPGMILEAVGLLTENPRPSREQIVAGMDRNLCRCGAHKRIVEAIEAAAART
ncbi:MAG: (2Fe-2S)-binding protein [Gemmatimonadota bacterium]|jgi:aerobic-type carbon monoxide dehydrogenase small subunit (CoxS/CutS family)